MGLIEFLKGLDILVLLLILLISISLALLNGIYLKSRGYSFPRSFFLTLLAISILGITLYGLFDLK